MPYNHKHDTHHLVGIYADRESAEKHAEKIGGEVETVATYTHWVWKERESCQPQ